MNEPSAIDWHPESLTTLANPYPVFSRMRDEDPCYWSPRLRGWVLTRYSDVKAMCLDKDGVSSDRLQPFFATLPNAQSSRIADIIRYLSLWMVFKDPPEHTRLRRLTSKVFSARAMQATRPKVELIAEHLLKAIEGRDRFDVVLRETPRGVTCRDGALRFTLDPARQPQPARLERWVEGRWAPVPVW